MPTRSLKIKRGGAMNYVNKQFKTINKLLKDPENMLIALLSLILLGLVIYYYRMENPEQYENIDRYD